MVFLDLRYGIIVFWGKVVLVMVLVQTSEVALGVWVGAEEVLLAVIGLDALLLGVQPL